MLGDDGKTCNKVGPILCRYTWKNLMFYQLPVCMLHLSASHFDFEYENVDCHWTSIMVKYMYMVVVRVFLLVKNIRGDALPWVPDLSDAAFNNQYLENNIFALKAE